MGDQKVPPLILIFLFGVGNSVRTRVICFELRITVSGAFSIYVTCIYCILLAIDPEMDVEIRFLMPRLS